MGATKPRAFKARIVEIDCGDVWEGLAKASEYVKENDATVHGISVEYDIGGFGRDLVTLCCQLRADSGRAD